MPQISICRSSVVLGNSIYESSATGPAGFSDPAHPACEVLRRAAVIRTNPTLATERCCQFTGSGIGTAAPEKRTSDESPIKNFMALTQLDVGAQFKRRDVRTDDAA